MENVMAEKKTKSAKKPAAKKTAAQSKKKAPVEDLVVFAFRLTPEERNVIHQSAGPARASKFVRAVALAAAREDTKAYQEALKEAREARS